MNWWIIGLLVGIIIVWFILFLYFVVFKKSTQISKQQQQQQSVTSPSPQQQQSPIIIKKTFNSSKTIESKTDTFYYMGNYLTYKNNRDMNTWGIDKPLAYTHAKINNIIFKFNNPNSSDSTGFAVDENGDAFQTGKVPATQYSNVLDFGFFI